MQIPTESLDHHALYRLLSGSIVPRPIAWVSTLSPTTGLVNLAPFSFFTACSVVPPMVCFAAERRFGERKDTVRNIEDSGAFTVNIVPVELAEQMVISAQDLPSDVSEVAEAGLHWLEGEKVRAPRIAEAPVSMECRLHGITLLGSSPHSLIVGQVLQFHVRDDVFDGGRIDFDRLDALGRLAGDWYTTIRERIRVKRLDYRKDSY